MFFDIWKIYPITAITVVSLVRLSAKITFPSTVFPLITRDFTPLHKCFGFSTVIFTVHPLNSLSAVNLSQVDGIHGSIIKPS